MSEENMKKKITLDLEIDPKQSHPEEKNPYSNWIHMAEAVNAWRIFPRIFITVYIYLLYAVVMWYIGLEDPTTQQSSLISVIVSAGAAWFGLYTKTGNEKYLEKLGNAINKK